jgi:hypothetical protein
MNIDPTTKANKIAIFVLLIASIAYHVILGMSSAGGNRSLFHSGIEFSTTAIRNTIEPATSNSFSPLGK